MDASPRRPRLTDVSAKRPYLAAEFGLTRTLALPVKVPETRSENQFFLTRATSVRHEVVFDTAWLDWNPDQVLRVAAGILRKQASDGMPRNAPGPLPEV